LAQDFFLDVRFHRLSPELEPYFTALYSFDVRCDPGAEIRDFLHPEWSTMRFFVRGSPPRASFVPEPSELTGPFPVSGPSSRAIDFSLTSARIWGLGLLPLGWARFCQTPACEIADKIVDGAKHPALAPFRQLYDLIDAYADDFDAVARKVDSFLLDMDLSPVPAQEQILACQAALRDPAVAQVEALAARVGVSRRSLERLCARYFGFPPKMLLRRQRFLRSLATYMLGHKGNWSKALDGQYYDQAHFVREFRRFMGMSPTAYAEMPHPILDRIIAQRMADHGVGVQTDLPTMLRYGGPKPQTPRNRVPCLSAD